MCGSLPLVHVVLAPAYFHFFVVFIQIFGRHGDGFGISFSFGRDVLVHNWGHEWVFYLDFRGK